jgi:acetyl esterase/lipase
MLPTLLAILMTSLFSLVGIAEDASSPPVLSGGNFKVKEIADISYYSGADAHQVKHKLDLYLPDGQKDYPVVIFVHGGAWRSGDKQALLNIYGEFGRTLARNGIGGVIINYRLSPGVKHPAHVQDVAKAFAWTLRNIANYGGKHDQIYLCGHSAGGHLVALLATDESYLQAEKVPLTAIKGVIPISGVYLIDRSNKYFDNIFGTNGDVRQKASPLEHVRGKLPPFLVIYAEDDYLYLDEMAIAFTKALLEKKDDARLMEIKGRSHISIVGRLWRQEDTTFQAVLGFIAQHAGLKLTPQETGKP